MKITGMTVYYDNKRLKTDAFGNNAAFLCPDSDCNHPVLLVAGPVGSRGLSDSSPAECQGCNRKYFVSSIDKNKIYIKSVGGCYLSNKKRRTTMTQPKINENGYIINAMDLTADDVIGKNILCPLCSRELHGWSQGWDAHAASPRCDLSSKTPEDRKAEYKAKLRHLFR